MPIYMKVEGIRGDVRTGGASGGVWKTTNFLTTNVVRNAGGGPRVVVFDGADGGESVSITFQISRISLTPSGAAVEGSDVAAKLKVEQLVNSARTQGPTGKLYIATDAGVYQSSGSPSDAQGRLVVGTDQGIWHSGGARRSECSNNLKQLGLAFNHANSVEILVSDLAGVLVGRHRMENATLSQHPGGANWLMCDGSVRF